MGETNNSNDDEKEIIEGDQDQDESLNDDGAEEGADGADKSDDDNSDDGEGADDDDKSKSKPTINVDEEPKTRKRNIDFIMERQAKKAEKQNNNVDEDDKDEDDDDIDGDDAKIIDRRVQKILSPFIQKQMQDEDTQEIADFVKQNPDFAPYAEKVSKFAQHPTRRNMPIKAIFYEVAGDDLLMIGAKRAQQYRDKAKESGAGGGSGTATVEKSVWDMTPEEFQAEQERVRNSRS